MTRVKIKKIADCAKIPQQSTACASGYDLYAAEEKFIKNGEVVAVRTGIAIEMLAGDMEAQVRGRSGLAFKKKVTVFGTGTIDHDYRGEIMVLLINMGDDYLIEAGDRIAQLVFGVVEKVKFEEVDYLGETERNLGGFGSTGK